MSLSVNYQQEIEVRAPIGTPWQEINAFIQDRAAWIKQRQTEFADLYTKVDYQYITNEVHYFLGRSYQLRVYSSRRNDLIINKNNKSQSRDDKRVLYLGVHALSNPESALYQWYRQQATRVFSARYDYWLKQAQEKLIIDWELSLNVVIKRLKSRWGSYSTRGRINLNLELIRYPQRCLDMIICHELCHVRELRHNKRFFNFLTKLYPDWQEQSQLLSRLSMKY
ncbi:M48 family metallopeptidase [Piscirickettsia salmonis]|uniref:M48 family metallopeptidase n=1 Tax=Piscirickettsia salmonis TaxID=1238 RepID=UPI00094AB6C8|nr:SprT family zinc-dependent metalloprotease [Piscirickettsia salmonis]PEQ17656.1 M48 family peptidase [Piscirickettsia salmonis]QHS34038.1 M48 family metallopeptidase [Piscirickettsia salmonis]QIX57076.1 M48 family metallopeptidase [Piscirickettsia salmonis]QNR82094.1 M48 family metallopeptidase [Piscirickettsia salmonis]WGZ70544.1 M48 family peptidase [Piscirickettsia salmonis EM-90]